MTLKETLLMAIDLGTSFIKTGVYDTDSNCVAIASEAVKDYRPRPGVFVQKGDELFESVLACMKSTCDQLGERAKNVEAIAFTGQMAGCIGVDENWNDITNWLCSLDGRSNQVQEELMAKHADMFLKISGTNGPTMAPKMKWFEKDHPEEFKKIAKYLVIGGYILGRLGELDIEDAIIDRTVLEWTGLADVRNDAWSDEILETLNIDRNLLPRIVNSNEICGHLSEKYANMVGLKAGIPLVSGAGDKAAGALGAAIVEKGDTIFEAASYGAVTACVNDYNPDMDTRRIECIPSAVPGEFHVMYYIAGSGITLDWFINTFVKYPGAKTGEMFTEIDEQVDKIEPGSEGVMAIGHLGGSIMPFDSTIRGTFMGYTWSHTKAHFYRSLLESYSYDFVHSLQRMEELYPNVNLSEVKIIGGGAKSKVWTQMNADVAMKPYKRLNREDIALWGGAILAGNAIGIFPDMKQTARDHVQVIKTYEPRPEYNAKYQKYMKLYLEFFKTLHGHFAQLAEINE